MMVNQRLKLVNQHVPRCTVVKMIKNYTDAIEVVEGGTEFVHLFSSKTLGISHHNLESYFSSFVRLVHGGRILLFGGLYLVFNFVDCAGNGCSQMFHTNMNMFHSVVGVWIVKDKGFLNFLMMVSKLFNLWSVTFNRSLKHKIIARVTKNFL